MKSFLWVSPSVENSIKKIILTAVLGDSWNKLSPLLKPTVLVTLTFGYILKIQRCDTKG